MHVSSSLKRTGLAIAGTMAGAVAVSLSVGGAPVIRVPVHSVRPGLPNGPGKRVRSKDEEDTLRMITFNIAHGRRDGFHQALCSRRRIESNLEDIAKLLAEHAPDVVALQEADGPSVWSGNFDHVEFLCRSAGFPAFVRGENVQGLHLHYGTALMSRLQLADAHAITFPPSPPTFPKGFVVATTMWPGPSGGPVDLVSVHLDFARASVRRRQIEQMEKFLAGRGHPIVVMGDFNSGWSDAGSAVQALAGRLNLSAHSPLEHLVTFPGYGTHLDWVLASRDLTIVRQEVLPGTLSDHQAVMVEVRRAGSGQPPSSRS